MDFSFDLNLDPMASIPVDLIGWALQIIPAAITVWSEKSGIRLTRGAYFWSLFWRIIGMLILSMIMLNVLTLFMVQSNGIPTPAMLMSVDFWISFWPLALAATAIDVFFTWVMVRPVVRRLRDAGIDTRWAYLTVIPVVDFIVTVALIFYPPSKTPLVAEATA